MSYRMIAWAIWASTLTWGCAHGIHITAPSGVTKGDVEGIQLETPLAIELHEVQEKGSSLVGWQVIEARAATLELAELLRSRGFTDVVVVTKGWKEPPASSYRIRIRERVEHDTSAILGGLKMTLSVLTLSLLSPILVIDDEITHEMQAQLIAPSGVAWEFSSRQDGWAGSRPLWEDWKVARYRMTSEVCWNQRRSMVDWLEGNLLGLTGEDG